MKCSQCGANLLSGHGVCAYCGHCQDVDLTQVHFRNVNHPWDMSCPYCATALNTIALDTQSTLEIEQCPACFGLFFNPGELEFLLEVQQESLVWLDQTKLQHIAQEYGAPKNLRYVQCPVCAERMHHHHFGGSSGVFLDQCGSHGLWLESGELQRLREWWRAGGKLLYQQYVTSKIQSAHAGPKNSEISATPSGRLAPNDTSNDSPWEKWHRSHQSSKIDIALDILEWIFSLKSGR